jgi:drug/metabolite transporter (DMT)-like permease
MKQRWLPVGILAGVLFAVNVAGRGAAKVWSDGKDDREINLGLVALVVIGVVMLAAAVRWVQRYPTPRVWGDFAVAVGAACLLSVLIGPFVVGDRPFAEGAGLFFRQIWWYLGVAAAGALFGSLIMMTLGRDWKSQAWKRYAEQARARPRRVARR